MPSLTLPAFFDRYRHLFDRHRQTIFTAAELLFALSISALWSLYVMSQLEPQELYNADLIWPEGLYRDVFVTGAPLGSWRFTPAPFLFPDFVLYSLCRAFVDDLRVAMVVAGALQGALGVVGTAWCTTAYNGERILRPTVILLLLLICLNGGLVPNTPAALPALLVCPFVHGGQFTLAVIAFGAGLRWLRSGRRSYLILAGVLLALGLISDPLLIMFPLATYAGAASLLLLLLRRRAMSRRLLFLGVSFAAGALGVWIVRSIPPTKGVFFDPKIHLSIETIPHDIPILLAQLGELRNKPLWALIVATGWLIAALGLIGHWKQREAVGASGDLVRPLFLSMVVVGVVVPPFPPLLAGAVDPFMQRVLMPTLLLPVFTIVAELGPRAAALADRDRRGRILQGGFCALFALVLLLFSTGKDARERMATLFHYQPPYIDCVDRAIDRHNLRHGIIAGQYGRPTLLFSRHRRMHIAQVAAHHKIEHWASNAYQLRSIPGPPSGTFALFDQRSAPWVRKTLGEPCDIEKCSDQNVVVFVYCKSYHELQKLIGHDDFASKHFPRSE